MSLKTSSDEHNDALNGVSLNTPLIYKIIYNYYLNLESITSLK